MSQRSINVRLKEAIDASNMSIAEIARELRIDRSAVSRMATGDRQISSEEAVQIADLLDINLNWLLRGHGEMLSAPKELVRVPLGHEFDDDHELEAAFTSEGYEPHFEGGIPEIDVLAGAGEGAVGDILTIPLGDSSISGHRVVGEWVAPPGYLKHELNVSPEMSVVLPVVGDSMAPTYLPGDKVIVDMRQKELLQDGVYIISDGMSPPQIKRLTRILFSVPAMVEIVSDNSAHRTQTVELSHLSILGRVAGRVSRQ